VHIDILEGASGIADTFASQHKENAQALRRWVGATRL
jgi:hypothetical protein